MNGNKLVISTLKPNRSWCDKDHVMLHACFQLLVDFLEKEEPQRMVDYKHDAVHRKAWAEMQALYRFRKKEYPAQERALDSLRLRWGRARGLGSKNVIEVIHKPKRNAREKMLWKKLTKADKHFQAREDEMLERLIRVRKQLWC